MAHAAPKDIVDISKLLIHPLKCDWGSCTASLNSWMSLKKHLYLHSRRARKDGQYFCKLPRCTSQWHSSFKALQTHMESSHMDKVSLVCPVKGCRRDFTGSSHLVDHIRVTHKHELTREKLSSPSTLSAAFSPLCIPFRPPVVIPPPLPPSARHLTFTAPVQSAKRTGSSSSQPISKWQRRLGQTEDDDDTADSDNMIGFEDLPDEQVKDPDIVVQPRHGKVLSQLSYPQSILAASIPAMKIPQSIHFDILVEKVAKELSQQ